MNIIKFISDFPDENSCRDHFRKVREHQGISCKKCGSTKHYWLKGKWQWQCSECRFRTGLRSGTMMEHAKLPIRKWYLAMAFMSFSKKGISATEMQRQLDHSRYESIWSMMHKIHQAMGKRDSLYELAGMLEFDEGYFETETNSMVRKNLKRGRGSKRQVNVAVMAESIPLEDIKTGKQSKHCRYFKMKVLETHASTEIDDVIKDNINEKSIVFSDKSTSYVDISKYVEIHITEKSTKETTTKTLPWAHIAISNAKRNFLGIYHKISGKYLQLYLDEFCYKLNRRYFGDKLFDRLTIALSNNNWYING
ncbi:MAG: IS1595 family transposase [Bacteroidetes bacterium]|nr:IS1595 family transposase [Bacteroidota bacterium]MBT5531390.1 IS1595 family transposase [Cytophagia bacterium]MBT3800069.1 IS1595 family transposase [Bacteroidota bacterium]MBT3932702.1 IS1595 family transposase [Bacteroidota bacterium]MBT4340289.1 IS1595 family transposase [Bacteroidota bacterium]